MPRQSKQAALESVAIEDVIEDGAELEEIMTDMKFVMDAKNESIATAYRQAKKRINDKIPADPGKVFRIGDMGEVKVLEKNRSAVQERPAGKRIEKSIQRSE